MASSATTRYWPSLRPIWRSLNKEKRLDIFLKMPREACRETTTDYPGDPNAGERAAMISYLGTLQ